MSRVAENRASFARRQHHASVEIDQGAFARNVGYLKSLVSPARLCVVMKADAYGHGLEALAPVAADAGADCIGVCTNTEAAMVRACRPRIPLLRLRCALRDELDESVEDLALEEQIGSLESAEYLHDQGVARGTRVPVHIKIDTGMGRSGFFPQDLDAVIEVSRMTGLEIVGVMTHLANADGPDLASATRQLDTFDRVLDRLTPYLPAGTTVHTHNSAATIRLANRRRDLVRVGAACYGVRTSQNFLNPAELAPVMSFATRIMELRDVPAGTPIGYGSLYVTSRPSRIATVPVGFGEGYPRALCNKGIVLVRGRRCPVVGRVSLNVTTIDVTDLGDDVAVDDEVVLVGRQGDEAVHFEELADLFASVHTEINLMAGRMNRRVVRHRGSHSTR
jgi:alanine racemase